MSDPTGWAGALDDDGPEALEANPGEWKVVTLPDGSRTTTVPNASSEAQAESWRLQNRLPSGSVVERQRVVADPMRQND